MSNAKWNLCLNDDARRKRGEADLCWCAPPPPPPPPPAHSTSTLGGVGGRSGRSLHKRAAFVAQGRSRAPAVHTCTCSPCAFRSLLSFFHPARSAALSSRADAIIVSLSLSLSSRWLGPAWRRYADDQGFDQTQVNSINAATIIDGSWYVVVKGDYAGRVSGAIYDITNSSKPVQIPTTVRERSRHATRPCARARAAAWWRRAGSLSCVGRSSSCRIPDRANWSARLNSCRAWPPAPCVTRPSAARVEAVRAQPAAGGQLHHRGGAPAAAGLHPGAPGEET